MTPDQLADGKQLLAAVRKRTLVSDVGAWKNWIDEHAAALLKAAEERDVLREGLASARAMEHQANRLLAIVKDRRDEIAPTPQDRLDSQIGGTWHWFWCALRDVLAGEGAK